MEFCNICPTSGLERWGTALSKHHLVLAQMLYNKEYMAYYAGRKQAGDFIILDNGAYENTKPIDSAAYFNYIKALSPDVVVLPDILMSPWRETTRLALRFLDEFAPWLEDHNYRTQWMFVPQVNTKNSDHFRMAVDTVLNDGRVGKYVTWIGLGRYIETLFGEGYRWSWAKELRERYPINIHALGMAAGDLRELKKLKENGVSSIDSSCATWRGWNGYYLDHYGQQAKWKTEGTPCDFGATLSGSAVSNIAVIEHNLEVIRNVISA